VPNIVSLGICFIKKIAPHQSWRICLIQHQNLPFFGVRFERRKVDKKKANLQENWNMPTLFWSILNTFAKRHKNQSL